MGSLLRDFRMKFIVLALLMIGSAQSMRLKKEKNGDNKRLWHVAASRDECGTVTELNQSHPAELCTQADEEMCICATKDQVTWKFLCGSCSFKLQLSSPENETDEAAEEEMEEGNEVKRLNHKAKNKKKKNQNKNKNKNSSANNNKREQQRQKLRSKLKAKDQKKQK